MYVQIQSFWFEINWQFFFFIESLDVWGNLFSSNEDCVIRNNHPNDAHAENVWAKCANRTVRIQVEQNTRIPHYVPMQ